MPFFSKADAHGKAQERQLSPETGAMLDVIIALVPAAFAGIAVFGIRAAVVIALTVLSSVLFEHLYSVIKKAPTTVGDLSAIITGLILAFSLPVKVPLYVPVFGSAVAIIAVKLLFGGRGKNPLNPALTARAALFLAFTPSLTKFTVPARNPVDAVSCATPMKVLSELDFSGDVSAQISTLVEEGELPGLMNMLFGVRAGCIGEVCAIALLLGGIYLILRGVISFALPVTYIGSFALCTLVFSGFSPVFTLYYVLSGALLLGAFFIATDPVTTADSMNKRLISGAAAGVLTAVIRFYTPLSEGVTASLLLMNVVLLIIRKLPAIKAFIEAKKNPPAAEEPAEEAVAEEAISEAAEEPAEEETAEEATAVEATAEAVDETAEEAASEAVEEAIEEAVDEAIEEAVEEAVEEPEEEALAEASAEDSAEDSAEENSPFSETEGIPVSPSETTPEEPVSTPVAKEPSDTEKEAEAEEISATVAPSEEKKETAPTEPVLPPSKPVFVNKPSSDTEAAHPAAVQGRNRKQGRKAKKKQKQMPDFSEPLPEVIPEFLKKEIEKQKTARGE